MKNGIKKWNNTWKNAEKTKATMEDTATAALVDVIDGAGKTNNHSLSIFLDSFCVIIFSIL